MDSRDISQHLPPCPVAYTAGKTTYMRAMAPTQYSETQYPFKVGKILIQAQNCCGQGRVFINLYAMMFTLIPLDCFMPEF